MDNLFLFSYFQLNEYQKKKRDQIQIGLCLLIEKVLLCMSKMNKRNCQMYICIEGLVMKDD